MFRSGRRQNFSVARDCKCGHPHECHYTKEGSCVYQKCECKSFEVSGRREFQNHRARCDQGHSHDSGLETKTCADLRYQKLAGTIRDYDGHTTIELPGPSGDKIATYEIDFVVRHLDGSIEYVECKGKHLERHGQWPLKWRLLQDKHKGDPMYKFRLIIE